MCDENSEVAQHTYRGIGHKDPCEQPEQIRQYQAHKARLIVTEHHLATNFLKLCLGSFSAF